MAKKKNIKKKKVKKVKPKKKGTKKRKRRKKKGSQSLSLVKAPISQKQLLHISQNTPQSHIYQRKAKGGGTWAYVTGVYVKKVLNYVFGWAWDFEVKEHGREKNLIWVLGRLTIKDRSGKPRIIKEQFGRADIKYYKDKTKGIVDYGNDLKAAATDALKKCASELGIASDIYGREEFKLIQKEDKGFIPPNEIPPNVKPAEVKENNVQKKTKIDELKNMLKGKVDIEKLADLKKRTSITLNSFDITKKHASILIASLLNAETKK